MIFDPFFAISDSGMKTARRLNRALLLGELLAIAGGAVAVFGNPLYGLLAKIVFLPAAYLSVSIINSVLNTLCRLAIVLYYGTSDPNEIAFIVMEKAARRTVPARKTVSAPRTVSKIERARPAAPPSPWVLVYDPNDDSCGEYA